MGDIALNKKSGTWCGYMIYVHICQENEEEKVKEEYKTQYLIIDHRTFCLFLEFTTNYNRPTIQQTDMRVLKEVTLLMKV